MRSANVPISTRWRPLAAFRRACRHELARSFLAAAIIALGKTLGVQVLAEGIESSAQYDALRALGCDYGQGFFIARPMELSATREWLAAAVATRAAEAA